MAVCGKIAASFPVPGFYSSCREELCCAYALFNEDPRIRKCRKYIEENLRENLGHGREHAEKVSVEAGALVYREGAKGVLADGPLREAAFLAEIAGLLHDLRREERDHARASAKGAEQILGEFSLTRAGETIILKAIMNHEAFVEPQPLETVFGQTISDALYDADKFRWGPDNFTVTLWRMASLASAPISRLISRFPKGMKGIARIKETFRTETGRQFGPEFIDLGLQMGEEIYRFLKERFAQEILEEERKAKTESARREEDPT